MKPFYISSTGAGLSATVAGFSLAGAAQAIVLLASLAGWDVQESIVTEIMYDIVQAGTIVYGLFGLLRKTYFKIREVYVSIKAGR